MHHSNSVLCFLPIFEQNLLLSELLYNLAEWGMEFAIAVLINVYFMKSRIEFISLFYSVVLISTTSIMTTLCYLIMYRNIDG